VGNRGLGGLAVARDGKTVAVRAGDGTIHLYDLASGKQLKSVGEAPAGNNKAGFVGRVGGFGPMAFAPDGATLALAGAGGNVMVQPGIAQLVPAQPGGGNDIALVDVATGKTTLKFAAGPRMVAALAFAPDGRTLAGGCQDGTIVLWEVASGQERLAVKAPGMIQALAYAADGRTLVAAGPTTSAVYFWDAVTGQELGQLKGGHFGGLNAFALAADGKTLVTGGSDTTALVWDTATIKAPQKAPQLDLPPGQAEALWNDLAGDGKKSYVAVRTLGAAPKQAVPMLAGHLKPVLAPDAKKLAEMIADLDAAEFAKRQQATEDLEKLGELAVGPLRQVLAGQPGLELQMRVERLLEKLVSDRAPPVETLRVLRALEALELAGTPEAREVLAKMAKGAQGVLITRRAQEGLDRAK
jgi:hypothetical protein